MMIELECAHSRHYEEEFGGFSAMIEHNFVLQLTQPELARSIEGFGIEIRSSCEVGPGGFNNNSINVIC